MEKINPEKIFLKLKRKKDKQAFMEAYDFYLEPIYRFIFFKVNNKEEAEDLASTVFIKFWGLVNEGKLGDYKTIQALLYKIARNIVIDYYRTNKQASSLENIDDNKNIISTENEEKIVNNLDIEFIKDKLFELKDEYREVLTLYFIEQISIAEISSILNKTKGNVRVMIHRAIEALKELLKYEE